MSTTDAAVTESDHRPASRRRMAHPPCLPVPGMGARGRHPGGAGGDLSARPQPRVLPGLPGPDPLPPGRALRLAGHRRLDRDHLGRDRPLDRVRCRALVGHQRQAPDRLAPSRRWDGRIGAVGGGHHRGDRPYSIDGLVDRDLPRVPHYRWCAFRRSSRRSPRWPACEAWRRSRTGTARSRSGTTPFASSATITGSRWGSSSSWRSPSAS